MMVEIFNSGTQEAATGGSYCIQRQTIDSGAELRL